MYTLDYIWSINIALYLMRWILVIVLFYSDDAIQCKVVTSLQDNKYSFVIDYFTEA